MKTEYLNKCCSLLGWYKASDFDSDLKQVIAEMEKLRHDGGFADLQMSFSNELVLNLIESENKDQMIRVVEAYLRGLAIATQQPLEWALNNHYSFDTSEMALDGKWVKVDTLSEEMYFAGCDLLLGLVMQEVQMICVSNEIDPREIIKDLDLRMRYQKWGSVGFLESYLSIIYDFEEETIEETPVKPISKIHWAKTDQSLRLLIEGLMGGLYVTNRDYSEVARHFQTQESDEVEFEKPINWEKKQRLLILMIKYLMKKNFIPHDSTPWLMTVNHFTWCGKSINARSLKSEWSKIKDGDIGVGGWEELDELLRTLQDLS